MLHHDVITNVYIPRTDMSQLEMVVGLNWVLVRKLLGRVISRGSEAQVQLKGEVHS